ncbi:MAG TPA: acyl-CoA carboxylase epsilon subunit [Jatrophihabitantaceae bacterium]|jgi:hypothetical protein
MSEHLRILHGSPTTEELAAVTAIVTAAAGASRESERTAERPTPGRWNDPAYAHRRHLTVGPGGWRAAR